MQTKPVRAYSTSVLILVFAAFISIGLPDAVLGVAWPEIRQTFNRNLSDLSFVLVSGAVGYFISSALAGTLIGRLGLGRVLSLSTAFVTIGLFGYATMGTFWLMVPIAILIGFGSGAVDAGLNHYAAEHFSVVVMSWLHAFFGIGATTGPFIMAATLGLGLSWRIGYAIVAGALFILTVMFIWQQGIFKNGQDEAATEEHSRISVVAALKNPAVILQILLFLTMCGLETMPSIWSPTVLRDRFDVPAGRAGIWTGLYWGSLTAGRLLIPIFTRHLHASRIVQIAPFGLILGASLTILPNHWPYQIGILIMGFSMAPMFPTLMSLTPQRYGKDVALHTIGLQVSAATLGIAAIPSLAGVISDRFSLVAISWTMLIAAIVVTVLSTLIHARTRHTI